MFTDDYIIFCKANKTAAYNIKHVLNQYCTVSGQFVNYKKSCIQFSNGVSNANKRSISQILQIPMSNKIGKYLGCNDIQKNRSTKEDFENIKRKLGHKLAEWKARTLSAAGKVVLTKSNLTNTCQYPVNWIKFPKCIATEIDKVNRDFSLENNMEHNNSNIDNLYILAWDKICKPKSEGSLGIRRTKNLNAAYLAKQGL